MSFGSGIRGGHVLVVEDDPVQAKVLEKLLVQFGMLPTLVSSGEEALKIIPERTFSLVISDWMMPEMSGVELCHRVRELKGRYVYFIVCTARTQRSDRLRAYESGVDDFLNKPVDREELACCLIRAQRLLDMQAEVWVKAEKLEEANRNVHDTMHGLPLACFTFDSEGEVHIWNKQCEEILEIPGYTTNMKPTWQVFENQPHEYLWSPEHVADIFAGEAETPFEWTYHRPSGDDRILISGIIPILNFAKKPTGAVCASLDITERKRQEQEIARYAAELAEQKHAVDELNIQLSHLAVTDGLTGLWNHRRFQESLEELITRAKSTGMTFSMVLLDIDFFKRLNDDYGHQTGDDVLRNFANVLKDTARRTELPARYGGEEFAVLLAGCSAEDALNSAERFRKAVQSQVRQPREVTCSIGISTWSEGKTGAQVIEEADKALYFSKHSGRNQSNHYDAIGTETAAA